jgi:hypothetical protein
VPNAVDTIMVAGYAPGVDKDRQASSRFSRLDVGRRVPDQDRTAQIETEFEAGSKQQTGRRLSARAPVLGCMEAGVDTIDATSCGLNGGHHSAMDKEEFFFLQDAATNHRLVCHDHNA